MHTLCQEAAMPASQIKPDLFVTWLPDPMGQDGYAIVIFYDDESKWATASITIKNAFWACPLSRIRKS